VVELTPCAKKKCGGQRAGFMCAGQRARAGIIQALCLCSTLRLSCAIQLRRRITMVGPSVVLRLLVGVGTWLKSTYLVGSGH
jgi:hypothetical protein